MSISIHVFSSPNARVQHHRKGAQHYISIEWMSPGSSLENEILWQKAKEYAQKHSIKQWLLDRSKISVFIPHNTWLDKAWLPEILSFERIPNRIAVTMPDRLFCQLLLKQVTPTFGMNTSVQMALFHKRKQSKEWLLSALAEESEILMAV